MAGIYKYTPALQKPEMLKSTLIGRDETLKTIVRVLRNASKGGSLSHLLLIGPKGIGKTHMLRTIYHCLKGEIDVMGIGKYRDSFVPVIFSEEEYITSAIKFLRLCIEYLKSERTGLNISDDLIRPDLDERQKELIIDFVKNFRKDSGRILLLLVDNFNETIEAFTDEDQSLLREILMTSESVLLIGTAPTLFNAIVNHGEPFYNFFEIEWLHDISFDDTKNLLKKLAELEQRHDILSVIEEKEDKLRAIYALSGGNPRLIISFYQIMTEMEITSVEETFQRMLDEMTPYFSARMKDLSPQQREIMDVIVQAEQLLTPTEIASRCGLPVNQVNAQIKRLEEMGYLHKVTGRKRKGVLYDVKERLFSLWRRMRVEAGRRRLGFIIRFIEIWFTKEEIRLHLLRTMEAIRESFYMGTDMPTTHLYKLRYYLMETLPEYKGKDIFCWVITKKDSQVAIEIEGLKKEVKKTPDNWRLWWKIAYAYFRAGDSERELEALKKVVKLKPHLHRIWYHMGNVYLTLNRLNEAIDAYRKALEIKPDMHLAWYDMGTTYECLCRYEEAIEAYRKAMEINPDNYMAWDNMGNAYAKLGRYEEAIEAYRKAMEIKPDMHEVWYKMGNTYVRLSRYEEAIEAYKKAVDIKPNKYTAWYYMGNAYAKIGRYEETIEAYRKAVESKPDLYEAWNNMGAAYTKLGKFTLAINALKKAIALKKDEPSPWKNLIRVYLKLYIRDFKRPKKKAKEYLKDALDCISHAGGEKEAFEVFAEAFKEGLLKGRIDAVREALEVIKETPYEDLKRGLHPFYVTIEYLDSRDDTLFERLKEEERTIVSEMIKAAKGKKKGKKKR